MVNNMHSIIQSRLKWGELQRQITISWRALLIAATAAAACIGAIFAIAALRSVRLDYLTRDIYAIAGQPVYYGLLSMLGIMGWSASAAIWLFGWALLGRAREGRRLRGLFLASAILSLILLGDDAFMLHEYVLPGKLGIPEPLVMLLYALVGLAYIGIGWRTIAATPYLPALCAGLFLGGALMLDQALAYSPLQTMVEDSLKFAGIAFWLSYAGMAASSVLCTCISGAEREPGRRE